MPFLYSHILVAFYLLLLLQTYILILNITIIWLVHVLICIKTCHKYQFAITWQAPIIWNDIPLTVRNSLTQEPWWAHTISNFKKKLRLHFLSTWISLWKTCWRAIELSLNFIRLLRVVITPSVVERRKQLEAIGWISGYIELISLKFLVSLTFLSPILYTLWTILGVFVCMI